MGKEEPLHYMMMVQLNLQIQKNEIGPFPHNIYNLKWVNNLNIIVKNHKTLRRKHKVSFCNPGFGNILSDMIPQDMKEKSRQNGVNLN